MNQQLTEKQARQERLPDFDDPFWKTRAGDVPHPLVVQDWDELTFLHWSFDPADLQKVLPDGVTPDTYDGKAWVGMVPFVVRRNHLPFLPPIPGFAAFPETNLRTYVRGPDNDTGVYFLSLDAKKLFAVVGARLGYNMNYIWSTMELTKTGNRIEYRTRRRRFPAAAVHSHVVMEFFEKYPPGKVDPFMQYLVFRYSLYTVWLGRLRKAFVSHLPYVLHRAKVLEWDENMFESVGLPKPTGDPVVQYCPGVTARISWLSTVQPRGPAR